MLKPKTKGLFVDISEYSVLVARTTGFKLPMVIEEVKELPLAGGQTVEEIRDFLATIVDLKGAPFYVARCGVYPEERFLRFFEADSPSKAKDLSYLAAVLKDELKIDPELNHVSILNADDGADFDGESVSTKHLIYCGGPKAAFASEQDKVLSYGLYPERLELSSVTTLGGFSDYTKFNDIEGPVLCLELTSKSAIVSILQNGRVEVARPMPRALDSIYPLLKAEMGLKDEQLAQRLFLSNTFDFEAMGAKLLRRITRELQASTGFYEVQTGQTIDRAFVSVLPKNLSWIGRVLADSLGLELLRPDYEAWLASLGVSVSDDVELANLDSRWMGLFSLMGDYRRTKEVADA